MNYCYDFIGNANLLQDLAMATLIDNNREMIANRLNVSISVVNQHILYAAALSAVKNGNVQRIADRFGIEAKELIKVIHDHPYLNNINKQPIKTRKELQLELKILTQRFDKLINDLNFDAILENQRLQEENQQLLEEITGLGKLEK